MAHHHNEGEKKRNKTGTSTFACETVFFVSPEIIDDEKDEENLERH